MNSNKNLLDIFKRKTDSMGDAPESPAELSQEDLPAGDTQEDIAPVEAVDVKKMEKDTKAEDKMIVKSCKDAYATFVKDAKSNPSEALDMLIDTLKSLKKGDNIEDVLPGEEAPLNMNLNGM